MFFMGIENDVGHLNRPEECADPMEYSGLESKMVPSPEFPIGNLSTSRVIAEPFYLTRKLGKVGFEHYAIRGVEKSRVIALSVVFDAIRIAAYAGSLYKL
jgi:hypothetical protein